MGDVVHGPWWPQRTQRQVDEIDLPISFPAGLIKIEDSPPCRLQSSLPATGFSEGDEVEDSQTGRRGVVTGRSWIVNGDRPTRPVRYTVRFEGEAEPQLVVACRLQPAPPKPAAPKALLDGTKALFARNLRRICWPPRVPDTEPPPSAA